MFHILSKITRDDNKKMWKHQEKTVNKTDPDLTKMITEQGQRC